MAGRDRGSVAPAGGHRGRLRHLARLAPAIVALYELRYLLMSGRAALAGGGHAPAHAVSPWLMAVVALVTVSLLLEVARGLPAQARVTGTAAAQRTGGAQRAAGGPRWSSSLVVRWLLCGLALMALAGCVTLLTGLLGAGHPAGLGSIFGTGTASSTYPAICVGLMLAASLGPGRWMLRAIARRRGRAAPPPRLGPAVSIVAYILQRPAPAPLRAGWSDRGPPATLAITAV